MEVIDACLATAQFSAASRWQRHAGILLVAESGDARRAVPAQQQVRGVHVLFAGREKWRGENMGRW